MSPESNTDLAPTFKVKLNGADLSDGDMNHLKSITIDNDLDTPDVCTLTVAYPAGGVDEMPFQIGADLEVQMGTAEETSPPKTVFKGQIVGIEPDFGAGGVVAHIRAFDKAHVLMRSRKTRTFQNMQVSDVVKKIVSEAGFKADVESSTVVHEHLFQHNMTDWQMISSLAVRAGMEFLVDGETAHLRKRSKDGTPVELEWPDTLISFAPKVTAVQQVKEVTVSAYDPKTKKAFMAKATTPNQIAQIGVTRKSVMVFDDAKLHVATEPVKSSTEANQLAQAALDLLANGYISAEGVAKGNPDIKAGAIIKVTGVGEKFSGTYRIAHARHTIRGGQSFMTNFANSASHSISGLLGGSSEGTPQFAGQLMIGIVTNNKDPDNLARVKVRLPVLSDTDESTWARIATTSAGRARGLLMLPVVGEEVLVGFEHNDITRPYVLGSLFSNVDKPDAAKQIQDNDGSFTLMSDKKIYAASVGDFVLTVGGEAKVEVKGNVTDTYKADWTNETTGKASIKAKQPLNLEGQSVTIKGTTTVSIEGSASLTLKCGGSKVELNASGVTISGPLINIG